MPRSSGDRYARARRCQNSTGAHTPLRRGACGPFGQRRRIPTHPRKGGAPRAEPRCAAFGASLRVLPRSRRRAGVQQQHQKAGRRYRRGVARANLVQVCGNRNRFNGFPIMLHDGTVVPAEPLRRGSLVRDHTDQYACPIAGAVSLTLRIGKAPGHVLWGSLVTARDRLTVIGSPVRRTMRLFRRNDEAICFGGAGIAKNAGVVRRIDAIRAARQHIPALIIFPRIASQACRSSAEDEGCRESRCGLGQHCRVSLCLLRTSYWYEGAVNQPIDRTVRSRHI